MPSRSGPLRDLRIVEFAGLGPAPFAAMLLSDMGADVVRIDRPGRGRSAPEDIVSRGRRAVELDLKTPTALAQAIALIERADVLIEGFRPGVMERLGLGPEVFTARHPRLVYARMTGWGQTGPLAPVAGHDINYIAITGALAAIGERGRGPVPPLNLVGDYGGGALYLVVGILAARLEALRSGRGQVIDCAMCDGVLAMLSMFHTLMLSGAWRDGVRGANWLDGGAPFYTTYECADGLYIAVGALEPQFYAELCRRAGLTDQAFSDQNDQTRWEALKQKAQDIFRRRTRQQWCALLEGTDACFAPVLTMAEAPQHPHLAARQSFVEVGGVLQAAPAPRFSRTPSAVQSPPPAGLADLDALLGEWSGPPAGPG